MRTREMNLSNYGVFLEDEEPLKKYCRKNIGIEERRELFRCCISAAPGLEIPIYDYLTSSNNGYRTMVKRGRQIPAKEDDFYAYCRKALYNFYDWLRLTGRWKY